MIVTDLGYMPELVKQYLREADFLILESNHDLEMLKVGPYPWYIKQRVMSRTGHLSNAVVSEFLADAEVFDGRARHVVLAHLSEQNNNPDVARISAEEALSRRAGRIRFPRHTSRRLTTRPARPLRPVVPSATLRVAKGSGRKGRALCACGLTPDRPRARYPAAHQKDSLRKSDTRRDFNLDQVRAMIAFTGDFLQSAALMTHFGFVDERAKTIVVLGHFRARCCQAMAKNRFGNTRIFAASSLVKPSTSFRIRAACSSGGRVREMQEKQKVMCSRIS